jgi:acetolactate synthase-1/2/3 large subunit
MAREGLDITVLVFNNRSYGILNVELARVGARAAGPRAKAQLDLSRPDVGFVDLSRGLGVPATRVETAEQLTAELRRAIAEPGPHVVEVVIPPVFSDRQLRAMPHALRALTALPRPVAAAVKRRLYP